VGQAATNEEIKFKATWLNSVSAGLFVGGFAVPYVTYMQKRMETSDSVHYIDFLLLVLVWGISAWMRWRGLRIIRAIKD
jgi:hypothetical protein